MVVEVGPAAAERPGVHSSRRPGRWLRVLGALVVSFAVPAMVTGCGEHDEPPGQTKQAVAFDDVPANLREAAAKAVPGVKLDEAWKNLDREGKLHSYEIRGRRPSDGKIREVRVSLTGEILEME
jgi:hypothetical protein